MSFATPTTTSTTPVWASLVGAYLVPLITIIGLIVLMALKDIDSATALPIITLLAGVHAGTALSNNAATNTTA